MAAAAPNVDVSAFVIKVAGTLAAIVCLTDHLFQDSLSLKTRRVVS
jgi:hypothetical protein